MKDREYYRHRRLVIAYAERGLVAAALAAALVLAGFGISRLFVKGETRSVAGRNPEGHLPERQESAQPEEEEGWQLGFPFTVVLDAGHGGTDSGTNVTVGGKLIEEKDITLSVTEKVKAALEECGVTVIMTRQADEYVSLDDRVAVSNREKPGFFLSLHCNAFEDDDSVDGLECYYWKNDEAGQEYAKMLAAAVEELEDVNVRGAKEGNYQVLRENTVPAVLVEMGFLSNRAEQKKLTDEEYQQRLAEKLVQGLLERAIENSIGG